MDINSLLGWQKNTAGIRAAAKENGTFASVARSLMGGEQKNVYLWRPILQVKPTWRRGAQKIGDCFAPGTIVMGVNDSKPIEHVSVGDIIFDGDGNPTQVVSWQKKISHQPLVTINTIGGLPLTVTADHLVLAYRFPFYSQKNKKRITKALYARINKGGRSRGPSKAVTLYENRVAEWIPAGELRESDFLLTPLSFTVKATTPKHLLTSTEDALWLFGYFLGDGHASGGSVEFAVATQAISDKIVRIATALGFDPRVDDYRADCGAWRVRVHNVNLVRWLRDTAYGHDDLKVMPAWAIGSLAVLAGLQAADGFNTDKSYFDSVSPSLAFGVYASWIMQGRDATIKLFNRSSGSYKTDRPAYRVTYQENRQRQRIWRDDKYLCNPVSSISVKEGPHCVYDIGVAAKSHAFIANGHVSHNCVSWGSELAATSLMATDEVAGTGAFIEEAATEPIYGGCRVEVLNKRAGGYSDGAFGYAAAKWLKEYGVLLRLDYSIDTKNPEHNLTKYSGDKAKQWGNFGCGGANDKGVLDKIAKEHPVKHIAQVRTIEEAIAACQNGYPIAIASMAGFGNMRRDVNGFCYWTNSWAHQMCVLGMRYFQGKPNFRCFQSWGDSCSGPDPGIEDSIKDIWSRPARIAQMCGASRYSDSLVIDPILPSNDFEYVSDMAADSWNPISACSWWINERDMARILSSGDCWTYSGVQGFVKRKLDFAKGFSTWG